MSHVLQWLWLAPAFPLLAAGLISVLPRKRRLISAALAIFALAASFGIALWALAASLGGVEGFHNVQWFQVGKSWVEIGWLLNPLTSVMLVMVALVSLLVFIYSIGYMTEDENFTRFFCFLSLFSAAMLGVVISNSLLLLFVCWELVGLASYLLIGFWFHRPEASAAAKKAFIVTRLGDLGFLVGMVVLFSKTGTLLFYNAGEGFLESKALALLSVQTVGPLALTTVLGLLIFAGAVGKSGQVPLHVWLPDAMEGPTPVSALIHAATMVAAGVFLVARVYPLMATAPAHHPGAAIPQLQAVAPQSNIGAQGGTVRVEQVILSRQTLTLKIVTWTGVLTALMAAGIAVRQNDIKRILAYSTVSQLGFMMAGLGMGGVAVGMFHLITHAFFKALLFLGAGSVIHRCHHEQDIRKMGGLARAMPVTFAAYAVGMLALSGFPLLFAGFWSKDAILHAAHGWAGGHAAFYLLLLAALLTGFYMTRQVCYVFLARAGENGGRLSVADTAGCQPRFRDEPIYGAKGPSSKQRNASLLCMTLPLVVLAACTVLLSLIGTPAWPWFFAFLGEGDAGFNLAALGNAATLQVLIASSMVALSGIGVGVWLFRKEPMHADAALEQRFPETIKMVSNAFQLDLIYDRSVVVAAKGLSRACDWVDGTIVSGLIEIIAFCGVALSWLSRMTDEFFVNKGFDDSCAGLGKGGEFFHTWQSGHAQFFLRMAVGGVLLLGLVLIWGFR